MKGKLVGIEILRFLSAFAVLIWHYQHFYFDPATAKIVVSHEAEPLYFILRPFYDFGWLGVNFFWTISGYVFYSQYLTKVSSGQVTGPAFFVRRFSRLYPLHFVTLLIVALLQFFYLHDNSDYFVFPYNSAYDFFVHLIFASGWLTPYTDSFNGPVWSVSTELVIYLVFFLAARYLRLRLIATLLAVALSGAIGVVMIRHQIKGSESNLFFCAFYYFMGGAVHLIVSRMHDLIERRRDRLIMACVAIYVVLIAFCALFGGTKYLAATVGAPVSIFLLLIVEPYIPQRSARYVVALGNTTYSSYLIHFPIQLSVVIMLQLFGIASATVAQSPVFLIVYMTIVFTLARLVYVGFEAPAQRRLRLKLAWLAAGKLPRMPGALRK